MEKKRKSRNKPTLTRSINLQHRGMKCNGKKTVPPANGIGKTRQLHIKE